MKEGYNYQPKQFDSEDLSPIATPEASAEAAEMPVEASAETVETPNILARGEARFQKTGETISGLKTRMKDFFSKIPQVASAWSKKAGEMLGGGARAAAVGVLSTPELVGAGVERAKETGAAIGTATMEGAEAGSRAILHGMNSAGEAFQSGTDALIDKGVDTVEKVREFSVQKGEQFTNYLAEKADAVRNVAELTSNYTAEKAGAARAGVENGIRSVTTWGERSLALAEAKRQETIQNLNRKMNEARYEKLRSLQQTTAEQMAQLESKMGLRNALAESSPLALAA